MLPSSNALAIFREEQRLTNAPNVQTTPLVFTEVAQRSGYGFPFSCSGAGQKNYAPPYLRIGGILHYSAADLQAFVMYTNLLPS
jgi:hypothetical protein